MSILLLEDVCRLSRVNKEVIVHFIQEKWVHPLKEESMELDEEDLARIILIRDLRNIFGVNEESMSIILQLIDQLNRMHLEIERLQQGEIL